MSEQLRIPVADWMFIPYEPFIGCWDGALKELERGLFLIEKYNMTAIIDLHALKNSQVRFGDYLKPVNVVNDKLW